MSSGGVGPIQEALISAVWNGAAGGVDRNVRWGSCSWVGCLWSGVGCTSVGWKRVGGRRGKDGGRRGANAFS